MEIALGVSMTSTTVHMVLVEGDKADGLTMECDQFATTAALETPAPSISEQVGAAILATQQSARRQGHHLGTSGIAVSNEGDADDLRTSLAARGVEDVILVGELQAAAALAHAVGRAVGYSATGLLFIKQRKATLCIVNSVDRSIVEVLSRSFIDADPTAVVTEMLADSPAQEPQGLFVVGAGEGVPAIKSRLEAATSLPIIFPEEPDWALARGAALAAATAPRFEASTSGLAYAQDPDEEDFVGPDAMPTGSLAPADVVTKHAVVDHIERGVTRIPAERAAPMRQRFVPVGSLAASAVVIGIVAVVMAMAVSNAPTSTQRVLEQRQILPTEPSTAAPPPPPVIRAAPVTNPSPEQQALPVPVPVPPPPPPAAKTVLVEQAPRTAAAQAPARRAQTWAQPVAEAQAPAVAPPAAAPIHVDPPAAAVPVPVPAAAPAPAAVPAPQIPAVAPSPALPPLSALMPRIAAAPVDPAPAAAPQAPILRWLPRLQWPQPQTPQVSPPLQLPQTPQAPQQISQWPQQTSQSPAQPISQAPQQISQWPQQTSQSPAQPISQWPQQTSQWPQQTPQWPQQTPQRPQQISQWPQQTSQPPAQPISQWPQQSSQSQWPQQTSQWPQQTSQPPLWPSR
jgi:hypothetical protein